jgi:uncharacterized membrane protein
LCLLAILLAACRFGGHPPAAAPVYRGYLFAGGEFRPCEGPEGVEWTLADPDRRMAAIQKELPPPPTPGTFWELAGTLSGTELRVSAVRRASIDPHVCGEEMGRASLRAVSSGASWGAEVFPDGIVFQSPETGSLRFTQFELKPKGSTKVYQASQNGRTLTLTIQPAPCWDRSVPAYFSLSIESQVDGKTLTGCAYESWKSN